MEAHSGTAGGAVKRPSLFRARTVAVRVVLVPAPGGLDDRLDLREAWLPVKLALRFLWCGIEHRRVSRTPRPEAPRHALAGDAFDRVDHLLHRMRAAGAEVVGGGPAGFDDCVERFDVRVG